MIYKLYRNSIMNFMTSGPPIYKSICLYHIMYVVLIIYHAYILFMYGYVHTTYDLDNFFFFFKFAKLNLRCRIATCS